MYLAVYGTLRKGFHNNSLLKDSEYIGNGKTVNKYCLRASGIPYLSKEPKHNVVIDLYKVDKDLLEGRIDSLEGHPRWYKRELIDVSVGNEIYKAWIYFNETDKPVIESGNYEELFNK